MNKGQKNIIEFCKKEICRIAQVQNYENAHKSMENRMAIHQVFTGYPAEWLGLGQIEGLLKIIHYINE